jgi:hypothetical protein
LDVGDQTMHYAVTEQQTLFRGCLEGVLSDGKVWIKFQFLIFWDFDFSVYFLFFIGL